MLTKRTDRKIIYLQAKHNCLWQEVKAGTAGAEQIEVTNPKTKQVMTKYGFAFDSVEGRAVKIEKYDTQQKYAARYFGFKLHLQNGDDRCVLDMPYQSQILRRFLRLMPNLNFVMPISITVFKGSNTKGKEEMAVWFRQNGETVKNYFTKETPNGMPPALYDDALQQWDFRAQHRWLVDMLQAETMPKIAEAARKVAPPVEPHHYAEEPAVDSDQPPNAWSDGVDDDDVPF